jgi:hypothetical protein
MLPARCFLRWCRCRVGGGPYGPRVVQGAASAGQRLKQQCTRSREIQPIIPLYTIQHKYPMPWAIPPVGSVNRGCAWRRVPLKHSACQRNPPMQFNPPSRHAHHKIQATHNTTRSRFGFSMPVPRRRSDKLQRAEESASIARTPTMTQNHNKFRIVNLKKHSIWGIYWLYGEGGTQKESLAVCMRHWKALRQKTRVVHDPSSYKPPGITRVYPLYGFFAGTTG